MSIALLLHNKYTTYLTGWLYGGGTPVLKTDKTDEKITKDLINDLLFIYFLTYNKLLCFVS